MKRNEVSGMFTVGASAQRFLHNADRLMQAAGSCGTACGAGDAEEKPEEKPTACGSACGAGDAEEKPEEKPTACGSACGAGDN